MKKNSYYLRKYWYTYVFAIAGLLLQVGSDMLSPQITRRIIDDVIGEGEVGILPYLLGGILLVAVGRAVGGYVKEYLFDRNAFNIGRDMRRNLFRHIQSLSVNYFDKTNTGEIMSRVTNDVDHIQNTFGYIGMLIIEVIIHMVMIMFCMYRLNSTLFIFPLIAVPVCSILAVLLENKLGKVYEDISEVNAEMNTAAQENIAGVRTVKAFAREKHEIKKFLKHNKKYYDLNMKQSKLWIRFNPLFQFVTKLLPLVSLLIGGKMVMEEEITLGTLGAFVEYCGNFVWPLEMLGWLSNELASAFASNKKLKKIYEEVPMICEKENPVLLPEVEGTVSFENVSLSIEDKEILKNISFNLPAGKTLGIMGATGAGKSSIINLLLRYYDTTEGSVKLDNVDVKDLTLAQLRGSTSLVMQDVFLFSDTIAENVKLGQKSSISREEIENSLEKAQAEDFVSRLEEKEDTVIGERGVGLSGGQKQRISMARAFAKKSPVLILDDSTSALDMETEHRIQKNLNEFNDVTKIIIAHRISAVRNADEILILENGQIAERGTHEELLGRKGYYYKTYMAQYGEFLGDEADLKVISA